MTDSRDLRGQIEKAHTLMDFVEAIDAHDLEIDDLNADLIQSLWQRDVRLHRAKRILHAEYNRLQARDQTTLASSERAPRYMDINDLDLVSEYEFTHLLAELLTRVEGEAQVLIQQPGQGVDVIWTRNNETVGIVVEPADPENPVTTDTLQDAYAKTEVHGPDVTIDTPAVVTTASVSNEAEAAAGNSAVELNDRSAIADWLAEAKLDAETVGTLLDEME